MMNINGQANSNPAVRCTVCFNIATQYLLRPICAVDSEHHNYTDLDRNLRPEEPKEEGALSVWPLETNILFLYCLVRQRFCNWPPLFNSPYFQP